MDECRKRLRKVGRKGVEGSSSDFYFASLDGNLVLDAGEARRLLCLGMVDVSPRGSLVGESERGAIGWCERAWCYGWCERAWCNG